MVRAILEAVWTRLIQCRFFPGRDKRKLGSIETREAREKGCREEKYANENSLEATGFLAFRIFEHGVGLAR